MISPSRRCLGLAVLAASALAVLPPGFAADDEQEKPVTLLAPPDRARIAYPDPASAVTTFAWRVATPGAYRLVIAKDSAFDRMVVNRRLTTDAMGVRGLAPGQYYWHVQLLDDDNAPVAISDAATFTVVAEEKDKK